MNINYDECLNENPFFKVIQEHHNDVIKNATEENWIICVPRLGTIDPSIISSEEVLEHVLVPNFELPNTHFCTLTKKCVTVFNKVIKFVDEEEDVNILFDETFYMEKHQKYKLWCIERPFHQRCMLNEESSLSVRTLQDCVKFLYKRYNDKLYIINKLISEFLNNNLETDSLEILKRKAITLYGDCLEIISNSYKLNDDTIKLAIETYVQHNIHHKLYPAVCNSTFREDEDFNRTHRNLYRIQLRDLEVKPELFESITNAKRELGRINRFTTVLGKIECLRRTINSFNQKKNKDQFLITTDDLIKAFTFLLIRCGMTNWIANLMYITHFRFSSLNLSDESSFLITTLEAATEYIKSGALAKLKPKYDKSLLNDNLNTFFINVVDGNLDFLKKLFNNKTKHFYVNKISLCHPLCSCEKCQSAIPYSINSCDDRGCTALHIACIYEHPHIVEYLISKTQEVNATDHSESTPLHYACSRGNQNSVLLLLHSKAWLDVRDCDGNTPLHLAANNGHEKCVKALLYFAEQKGSYIDVNAKNNNGDTPLYLAAKWGFSNIVHSLLQYGANTDEKVWEIAHNSHLKKLLLNFSDEPTSLIIRCNHKITKTQHIDTNNVKQIKRIDLVLKSIENNDIPLMCYYLGIPNPINTVALESRGVCHPLCNCDKCINQLESAATSSYKEIPEPLNINTCNSEGYSPLHVAAKCGRTEILRLLLDSAALVNVRTFVSQLTPLHLACKYQRIQIVRELLKCGGCNLDVQDVTGNTPLYYACISNDTRIVELLLSHGCNSNIKNYEGKTCLQEASNKMLFSVMALLSRRQHDFDAIDNSSDQLLF